MQKIPKVIHYVWVGDKPLTTLAKNCIDSWKKYLPEYQLKLWNEKNSPMDNPYVVNMYKRKNWAFVADYIRFFVLEKEGGIYLDTDTEVLKSFDDLLESSAFFGRTKDQNVATGVIGVTPNHQLIKDILDVYNKDLEFSISNTSPKMLTAQLSKKEYPDVVIYDYQYFNPCSDGEDCSKEKLTLAYTINHWAESWVPFSRLRKALRRTGIMPILKKLK